MPSESTRLALADIRSNVQVARDFVGAMTLVEFAADRRTFYAVMRCLEIVSEASRRLPEATRAAHPELSWRAIMRVGNVYRHDYDDVSEELVWRTVQQSLGRLLAVGEFALALP